MLASNSMLRNMGKEGGGRFALKNAPTIWCSILCSICFIVRYSRNVSSDSSIFISVAIKNRKCQVWSWCSHRMDVSRDQQSSTHERAIEQIPLFLRRCKNTTILTSVANIELLSPTFLFTHGRWILFSTSTLIISSTFHVEDSALSPSLPLEENFLLLSRFEYVLIFFPRFFFVFRELKDHSLNSPVDLKFRFCRPKFVFVFLNRVSMCCLDEIKTNQIHHYRSFYAEA